MRINFTFTSREYPIFLQSFSVHTTEVDVPLKYISLRLRSFQSCRLHLDFRSHPTLNHPRQVSWLFLILVRCWHHNISIIVSASWCFLMLLNFIANHKTVRNRVRTNAWHRHLGAHRREVARTNCRGPVHTHWDAICSLSHLCLWGLIEELLRLSESYTHLCGRSWDQHFGPALWETCGHHRDLRLSWSVCDGGILF